jgi:hypothetical protein
MTALRFSVRWLLAMVALVALACASYVTPNPTSAVAGNVQSAATATFQDVLRYRAIQQTGDALFVLLIGCIGGLAGVWISYRDTLAPPPSRT